MDQLSFSPEVLAGFVGLLLTLVFAYFPKLRVIYGGLASEAKSGIMLGLLTLTALVITLLAMNQVIVTTEPVTWMLFVKVLFTAIVVNQPAYTLLPVAGDVKEAKLLRDSVG